MKMGWKGRGLLNWLRWWWRLRRMAGADLVVAVRYMGQDGKHVETKSMLMARMLPEVPVTGDLPVWDWCVLRAFRAASTAIDVAEPLAPLVGVPWERMRRDTVLNVLGLLAEQEDLPAVYQAVQAEVALRLAPAIAQRQAAGADMPQA